jgi:predicted metal-dependent phosphoesterase TrpH
MLRVEFHCHTCYSKDSRMEVADLLDTCTRKGIDRVVITDHNSVEGALSAREIDPTRVIVGEEIFTTRGEILASFVTEEIPRGLEPREAISRLRDQGAFISVSHPFDTMRSGGWDLPDLEAIAPLVDAIEVFNSRCMKPEFNRKAAEFARNLGLPGTVGSDAHGKVEVGTSTLVLPEFSTAEELRGVIRQGEMDVRISPWWVHFISSYARWSKQVENRQ